MHGACARADVLHQLLGFPAIHEQRQHGHVESDTGHPPSGAPSGAPILRNRPLDLVQFVVGPGQYANASILRDQRLVSACLNHLSTPRDRRQAGASRRD
jgi:hypothetical protein